MFPDENVVQLIAKSSLNRIQSTLQQSLLASNRMITTSVPDTEILPGRSKIGGSPDLPASTEWPMHDDAPLTFIAQIRLEDVPWKPEPLPQTGILLFFYDAIDQPWGYDPNDAGRWKVIHITETNQLERRTLPEPVDPDAENTEKLNTDQALLADFDVQTTIPSLRSRTIRRLELTENEMDHYMNLAEQVNEYWGEDAPLHRFLGHADHVQSEMQLKCQLVSHGIDCGDPLGYQHPRRKELEPGADGWLLLLQIDSIEELDWIWGDFGMIYFWIHEDDLKKEDFDRVWVVLQCG